MASTSIRGNWNYPTPIRFGPGRIKELPNACQELGIERPLLVTDPGLAALPIVEEALRINILAGIPTAMFCEVQPNPLEQNVLDGVQAFAKGNHDGIVAMGGGSALDVGKAIGLMVGQNRPLRDFEDVGDNWLRVNESGMVPVVAVPTTSGTGSEVGRAAVIGDAETHQKRIIFHPKMLPGRVICDPALTIGLSSQITAAVGMDALSHNLEAFCAPGFHPMADGIAMEGIRLVAESLPTAVREPTNMTARANLMAASTLGATAFQKGLGAMHSMSHPISAKLGSHHGLTNAVVMPYVLNLNRDAIADRMICLARLLDLPEPSFMAVLDWVLALRAEIGIPHTLAEIGVTEAHASVLAPLALADPSTGTNPKRLSVSDFERLFVKAVRGELS